MKNVIGIVALVSSLLLSVNSVAVGLGDARLMSSLGQPLKVIIPVSDTGQLSADDIRVKRLHNSGDQAIEQDIQFTFTLQHNAQGELEVLTTTKELVAEPYVAFTLSLEMSQGVVSRQYVLMLDF
jgi:pilus assembly protein FimV